MRGETAAVSPRVTRFGYAVINPANGNVAQPKMVEGLRTRLPEMVITHYIEDTLIPLMNKEAMHGLNDQIPSKLFGSLKPDALKCGANL